MNKIEFLKSLKERMTYLEGCIDQAESAYEEAEKLIADYTLELADKNGNEEDEEKETPEATVMSPFETY